ncbi:hypothetical protein KUTeg_020242 [Tegillarca granosa]|uniref:Uncharacterized protein n=1 Tax=Tegillarca granosa TaxID=220873 RepID=A0ABQ9ECM9_TEGGR|nr:hypothetical protein KUTeg_020242 [Tegillarca granosa]
MQAIHRIPGKAGFPRPVIVKIKTEVKSRIIRKRKDLKGDVRFYDDITQGNLGPMPRLTKSEKIHSVWFFNDSVYAKETKVGHRIKFDIFDNIEEKLKQKGRKFCFSLSASNLDRQANTFLETISLEKDMRFVFRNLLGGVCETASEKFLKWEDTLGSYIENL